MATFMDFGVGTFLGVVVAHATGVDIPLWYLPLTGILALVPDLDIAFKLLRTRTIADGENHHESLMHRPILMVPAVSIALWVICGSYWGIVGLLCLTWHYIHDSLLGIGGFPLFWPVSCKYLSWRGLHEPSFMHHEEWTERYWRIPSYLAVWEVSIGSLALAAAITMQTGLLLLGIAIFCTFFLGAWIVWLMHGILRVIR